MGTHLDISDSYNHAEFLHHETPEDLSHRKQIRKLLEKRLEQKRLREEIDELDGDFDWGDLDK